MTQHVWQRCALRCRAFDSSAPRLALTVWPYTPLAQVKGAEILDYTSQAERISMLNRVAPAMAAAVADSVEYPSALRYLQSSPMSDIARPSSLLLRTIHHRAWVDAFFSHERAGAHRILDVCPPRLNLLEDSPMTIEFAYEDESTGAPTAATSST
jgi:hypothetical protein